MAQQRPTGVADQPLAQMVTRRDRPLPRLRTKRSREIDGDPVAYDKGIAPQAQAPHCAC
jgi:hypothetical protein